MKRAGRQEHVLHYGDTIAMYDVEAHGFISGSSVGSDTALFLDLLRDTVSIPPNLRDTRFILAPRRLYDVRKKVEKHLQYVGMSREYVAQHGTDDEELKELLEREKTEEMINLDESRRLDGTSVAYGSEVQLLHEATGRMVTVIKTVAHQQRSALRIVLEEGGNEGSRWIIQPGYKTQSEGSRVRANDVIKLKSVKFPAQHLNSCPLDLKSLNWSSFIGQSVWQRREVNAASNALRVRAVPIAAFSPDVARENMLKGGSVVCFYHKETDTYLVYEDGEVRWKLMNHIANESKHVRLGEGGGARRSSNCYWKVEGVQVEWAGEPIHFSRTPFRLQHLATSLYLGADTEGNGELFMTSENQNRDTWWFMEAFDSFDGADGNELGAINFGSLHYLRNLQEKYVGEHGLQQVKRKASARLKYKKARAAGFMDRDTLLLHRVPRAEVDAVLEVSRCMAVIREYAFRMETIPENIGSTRRSNGDIMEDLRAEAESSCHLITSVLARLIMSSAVSDDKNPMTREGIPNRQYQKYLRDQGAAEEITRVIAAPFDKGLGYSPESHESTGGRSIYSKQYLPLLRINQLAYRLLKCFVARNRKNKILIAHHTKGDRNNIEMMQAHLGGEMKSAFALLELFSGSRELLTDHINDSVVKKFVELISKPKGKRPRFIRFLAALATIDGDPISSNQNMIVTHLVNFTDSKGILPGGGYGDPAALLFLDVKLEKMTLGEASTKLPFPEVYKQEMKTASAKDEYTFLLFREKGSDRWIYVNQWMGSGDEVFAKDVSDNTADELLLRYYVRSLELLADLLLGRNPYAFTNIVVKEGIGIRYEELLEIAFHRLLPYHVRKAAHMLLYRLYFDRDPYFQKDPYMKTRVTGSVIGRHTDSTVDAALAKSPRNMSFHSMFELPEYSSFAPTPGFSDYRELAKSTCSKMVSLDSRRISMNDMIRRVLECVRYFFTTGISPIDEIREWVPIFVQMLNGKNDFVYANQPESRFLYTEGNLAVVRVKMILMELLELIFDKRAELRLGMFFRSWEESINLGGHRSSKPGRGPSPVIPVFNNGVNRVHPSSHGAIQEMHAVNTTSYTATISAGTTTAPNTSRPIMAEGGADGIQPSISWEESDENKENPMATAPPPEPRIHAAPLVSTNALNARQSLPPQVKHKLERPRSTDMPGDPDVENTSSEGVTQRSSMVSALKTVSTLPPKGTAAPLLRRSDSVMEMLPLALQDQKSSIMSSKTFKSLEHAMFEGPLIHKDVACGSTGVFVEILLDLVQYVSYPELVKMALKLFFRHMQQRASFVKIALQQQAVITRASQGLKEYVMQDRIEITLLLKWLLIDRSTLPALVRPVDANMIISSKLNALTELLNSPSRSIEETRLAQTVVAHSGIHKEVLRILHMDFKRSENMVPLDTDRRDLFQTCYTFLAAMSRGHRTNQQLLFPEVLYFADHIGTQGLNVADTIIAIIEDNQELAMSLPEKVIQRFLNMIETYGKKPRWLRPFHAMLYDNGVIVKKSQTVVLKMLLDSPQIIDLEGHIIVPYGSDVDDLDLPPAPNTARGAMPASPFKYGVTDEVVEYEADGPKALNITVGNNEEIDVRPTLRNAVERLMKPVRARDGEGRVCRLITRHMLLARQEYLKPMGSRLQYHATSLNLLAQCCEGKHVSNEAKCRALLPFPEVMGNLVHRLTVDWKGKVTRDDLRFIKAPYVNFMRHVYVDTNSPIAREELRRRYNMMITVPGQLARHREPFLADCVYEISCLAKRLARLTEPLETLEEDVSWHRSIAELVESKMKPTKDANPDPKMRDIHIKYVAGSVIPMLELYYKKHYGGTDEVTGGSEDAQKAAKLTESLSKAVADLLLVPDLRSHLGEAALESIAALWSALRPWVENGVIKELDLRAIVADTREEKRLSTSTAKADVAAQDVFINNVKAYATAIGVKDITRLIGKGLADMCDLMTKHPKSLRQVISFLHSNADNCDGDMLATGLRLVRGTIFMDPRVVKSDSWDLFVDSKALPARDHRLREIQCKYADMGALDFGLELIGHSDPMVSLAALRLSLILTEGGNTAIQDMVAHKAAAFESRFFVGVQGHLRLAAEDVRLRSKDRKRKAPRKARMKSSVDKLTDDVDLPKPRKTVASTMVSYISEDGTGAPPAPQVHEEGTTAEPRTPVPEPPKRDGHILTVINLLHWCCDGGHREMQTVLRGQSNAVQSVNILAEVVNYAMVMHVELDLARHPTTQDFFALDVMDKVFRFFIECISGPNKLNQSWLASTNLFELVNRVMDRLTVSKSTSAEVARRFSVLKVTILRLLCGLLEGIGPGPVAQRMLNGIDWVKLHRCCLDTLELVHDRKCTVDSPQWCAFVDELMQYWVLACELEDLDALIPKNIRRDTMRLCPVEVGSSTCAREARCGENKSMCVYHGITLLDRLAALAGEHIRTVEVVRNDQIFKLMYSLHSCRDVVRAVNGNSTRALLNKEMTDGFDDNPVIRTRHYVNTTPALLYHSRYRARLRKCPIPIRFIPFTSRLTRELPFALAVVINILVMCFSEHDRVTFMQSSDIENFPNESRYWVFPLTLILGVIHFVLGCLMLVVFFIERAPSHIYSRMNAAGRASLRSSIDDDGGRATQSRLKPVIKERLRMRYLVIPWAGGSFFDLSTWNISFYYVFMYPFFSFLGVLVSPLFFSYHLLDVWRDEVTQLVLRSVYLNIDKLIRTFVLCLVILYFFAIAGFVAFDEYMPNSSCDTLFSCFVSYSFYTAIGSPVLDAIDTFTLPANLFDNPEGVDSGHKELAALLFGCLWGSVFVVFLLAIISGIIIDSFGELRDDLQRVKDNLSSHCYVCGLDRWTLDENGDGFDKHVESEHNPKDYLLLVAYLEDRPFSQLSGMERFFLNSVLDGNISIFPTGRCFSTQRTKRQEEAIRVYLEQARTNKTDMDGIGDASKPSDRGTNDDLMSMIEKKMNAVLSEWTPPVNARFGDGDSADDDLQSPSRRQDLRSSDMHGRASVASVRKR